MEYEPINYIKTMLIGTAIAIGVYFAVDYVYGHLDEFTIPMNHPKVKQQGYDPKKFQEDYSLE